MLTLGTYKLAIPQTVQDLILSSLTQNISTMAFDLTDYKLLSFDIYGTLIDWETGICDALMPLINHLPADSRYRGNTPDETRKLILRAFSSLERPLQREQPTLAYNELLAETYRRLAPDLGVEATDADARRFGASPGAYLAFPDTVAAMKTLGSRYKLVALSNVDNENFRRTLSGPLKGVEFDGIYTAEDIGSYKPDLNNFRYLIRNVDEQFGVSKDEILHTAHSLTHDHVPRKEISLRPGVWISRADGKGGAMGGDLEALEKEGKVELGAIYETLGDMAEAVEKAFLEKK